MKASLKIVNPQANAERLLRLAVNRARRSGLSVRQIQTIVAKANAVFGIPTQHGPGTSDFGSPVYDAKVLGISRQRLYAILTRGTARSSYMEKYRRLQAEKSEFSKRAAVQMRKHGETIDSLARQCDCTLATVAGTLKCTLYRPEVRARIEKILGMNAKG